MRRFAFRLRKRGESGQAMTEFALVLPIFLAMCLFVIDFGWIAYQKAAFDYSYMHASWEVVGSDLSKHGSYDDRDSISVPDSSSAVAKAMESNPFIGYDPASLTVSSSSATLYNEVSQFSVPDRKGEPSNADRVTRRLSVKAKITYVAKPIVGFVFGPLTLTKDIDIDRIVGVENRTR